YTVSLQRKKVWSDHECSAQTKRDRQMDCDWQSRAVGASNHLERPRPPASNLDGTDSILCQTSATPDALSLIARMISSLPPFYILVGVILSEGPMYFPGGTPVPIQDAEVNSLFLVVDFCRSPVHYAGHESLASLPSLFPATQPPAPRLVRVLVPPSGSRRRPN